MFFPKSGFFSKILNIIYSKSDPESESDDVSQHPKGEDIENRIKE